MNYLVSAAVAVILTAGTVMPAFADGFDDAVDAKIRTFVSYPTAALDAGDEGKVGVRVEIAADGHVAGVHLASVSGSHTLDLATLRAIRRAAPTLPAVPGAPRSLNLVVDYRLS